jgi:uncharacterized repeat protein (TIGR02543 family)
MSKQAWFFKNKTVWGILGLVLVFAMFATGCPNGTTDDPTPPKTYTVTFNVDGGSAVSDQIVEEGKTVTKPANPTKAGNTFANWYRDAAKTTTLWNFATDVVVQDTTIYAKWVEGDNVPSFEVTFNTDGGSTAPAKQTVLQGEPVQEPATKPTKTGYIFDGWYNGNDEWDFSEDTVTAAVTLKAKWIEAVTVTFNTNGGSAIAPVTVAKDDDVYLYNYRPTQSGNVFDGWYTDTTLTQPAGSYLDKVTANITLHAKWTSTSALADYAGVWRREGSYAETYWLQADGAFWRFYNNRNDSYFGFNKGTWSTSQIDGSAITFNGVKTEFTTAWYGTFTKNTATTKTPAAATGGLLGVWVNGGRSVELKVNGDAVLDGYGDTITLKYCAEADAVYLLLPQGNLVIVSIGITDGKLNGFSKQASDSSLAGIWKLTEGGQDYYWNLKADGSGTFHTLGVSLPFSFTVTENKRIDGYDYTVSGSTLTLPDARWDSETYTYFDLKLTKVASVGAGSGAGGDSRLHGTWGGTTMYGETVTLTINSNGVMTESWGSDSYSYIWKADGSTVYQYEPYFGEVGGYSQNYSVSGSTLTVDGDMVFTKK